MSALKFSHQETHPGIEVVCNTTSHEIIEYQAHLKMLRNICFFVFQDGCTLHESSQVMWHSPTRPLCPQVHQSSLSRHQCVLPPHMKCTRHTAWDREKEHMGSVLADLELKCSMFTPLKIGWKKDGCKTTFLGGLHLFTRELLPSRRVFLSMVGKVGYDTVAIPVLSEFLITDILSVDFPGVRACRSAKTSPMVQYGS